MILVGNGTVVTRDPENPFIFQGAVVTNEQGLIEKVGTWEQLEAEYPQAEFVDAHGGVIMPGLINMHHHIYSAFARGLSLTNYNPKGFMDILEGMWWRLDRTLDLADTYHSATSTYLDCIRNGVTTVFDHHASYGAITGSLHEIGRAADLMGIRTCLCYEVSDRDGADKCRESIEENLSFIHTAAGRDDDMQHAMMGMHAAFTLSDKTLEACLKDLPQGVGCHVHVAEGMDDATHSLRTYGCSVVRRLMDRGVLGPQSIAAHSIHLNWEDMQLLKESQTMVVHNPESNMGNAVGCANIPSYYQAGLCLGLGTDGYTSDMLESYKAANALAKHNAKDPTVGWTEIPSMLFEGNPALAGRYFRTPLGVLKEQAAADIIILDYDPLTPMTADNINGHLLFGTNGRSVITTMVAGKVLMKDRVFQHVDEAKILADARQQAAQLWSRVNR